MRWSICIINSVDKTHFRVSLPHRRSTTVSLELIPFTEPLKKLIDRVHILPRLFLSRGDDDDVRDIGKHDFRSVLLHAVLSNTTRRTEAATRAGKHVTDNQRVSVAGKRANETRRRKRERMKSSARKKRAWQQVNKNQSSNLFPSRGRIVRPLRSAVQDALSKVGEPDGKRNSSLCATPNVKTNRTSVMKHIKGCFIPQVTSNFSGKEKSG